MEERDKAKKERKADYMRAYRAAHPECRKREAEYGRAYYKANRERRVEYSKAWYAANKEHKAKYKKAYCGANKDRIAEYKKAYRKANRERRNEYHDNYLLSLAEQNPDGYASDESRCGENSSNWKGGGNPYRRPTEFRVNRLIVLNAAEWVCYECGRDANRAHHIDFSKDNHAIDNLLPVCRLCHEKIHRNEGCLEEVYA